VDLGIAGRAALVCASTSGLGLAIARSLAHEGVRTALCGRRGELAEKEAAALPAAWGFGVDLTDPLGAERAVRLARERCGPLHILVLNTGGPPPGRASEESRDSFQQAIDRLLLTQQDLVRLCLPDMLNAGWGRIIAIGSSGVAEPIPGLAASNVGRAALSAYLKTLAEETAEHGVTVNMLLPGRFATDRVAALDAKRAAEAGHSLEEERNASESAIPIRRYGRPEEFAAVATFLASAHASYVTGTRIRVDGGSMRSL